MVHISCIHVLTYKSKLSSIFATRRVALFLDKVKKKCPCVRACVRPKRFFCSAKWRPGFFYFKLFLHQIIWSIEKNFGFFDRPIFFRLFWLNFCHNTPIFFYPHFFSTFWGKFSTFSRIFFRKKVGVFFFSTAFLKNFFINLRHKLEHKLENVIVLNFVTFHFNFSFYPDLQKNHVYLLWEPGWSHKPWVR